MRQLFVKVILIVGSVFICSTAALAAWVESHNQGMYIRHPQGWRVVWDRNLVVVHHPKDPEIRCFVTMLEEPGATSQLIIRNILNGASQAGQGFKLLLEKRIASRPDIYGAKFTFVSEKTDVTALALVVTENGRNFWVREYIAPTKTYDDIKLTLIPILCSFRTQEGGGAGDASASGGKGWQVIQSPHGKWRFTAPTDWRVAPQGRLGEDQSANVLGPKQQSVTVEMWDGAGDYSDLIRYRVIPPQINSNIPFMPAHELFQRIIVPALQVTMHIPDLKIENIQALDMQTARYTTSHTPPGGKATTVEGIIRNSSVPTGQGGDFNVYTLYLVAADRDTFPSVKDEAWQILMSFEPSQQWGGFLMQQIARMRHENVQAATNRALQTMQSNKQIMQQHVAIAQQKPGMMAQQGQGWINAITGQEVVRDPQSGQPWQVPVGGQYIYGRNTGEVIRADRPLQTHELPEGFRQFEAVK